MRGTRTTELGACDPSELGQGDGRQTRKDGMNTSREKDPETYAIIGAAMEVHRELGSGFLEAVYQDALAVELTVRGIPFKREVATPVRYKGQTLPSPYRADFICCGGIIVELKATDALAGIHEAQVINYLKATGLTRALLLNFGAKSLEYKRFVLTPPLRESA